MPSGVYCNVKGVKSSKYLTLYIIMLIRLCDPKIIYLNYGGLCSNMTQKSCMGHQFQRLLILPFIKKSVGEELKYMVFEYSE